MYFQSLPRVRASFYMLDRETNMSDARTDLETDEQRLREVFGANVRELRKQASWSQAER